MLFNLILSTLVFSMGFVTAKHVENISLLISDVIGRLASEENAQCVILVDESRIYGDMQRIRYEVNYSMPSTLFESSNVRGEEFARSGRACPLYIMHFQNGQQTTEFLHINEDSVRLILNIQYYYCLHNI